MIVQVDTERLGQLVEKGKDILFSPQAEMTLLELLEMESTLKAAIDDARHQIEEAALQLNPNFSAVIGDKVRVQYRYFGAKYKLVPGLEREVLKADPELLSVEEKFVLNTKALEKYEKKTGQLPYGVTTKDRTKQISIRRTDDPDEKEE